MRKLPRHPARTAVRFSSWRANSQDVMRGFWSKHQQHLNLSIVRNHPTSQTEFISDCLPDTSARQDTPRKNYQESRKRDATIRSQIRSGRRNSMLRFAPAFIAPQNSYTKITDKCSNLLVAGTLVDISNQDSSTYFKRSLAGLSNRPILNCKHFRTLGSLSPQMSSNARNEDTDNNKYEPREISFKTPFGHVACLEWGQRQAPNKILCAHGWLDNAGSFEQLIPFVLKHQNNYSKYHVVAMDMPGVGHSSHRPLGAEYTTFSHIIEMRRVTQQLGWNQNLTLLGHSLGGHLSFLYSCVYPKQVSSLISIDTTHPLTHQAANWQVTIGNSIEHYFKCENYHNKNEKLDTVVPLYSEEDAIKRLMDAHNNSLTLESAKVMFKRGATRHPTGGCTFNRDVRLRHLSVEFRPDDELMLKLLEHTFRPENLLIIRALRSPYHRPEEMRLKYYSLFERNCKLFRDIMLDGTHHLHMNTPDLVAIEINRFLEDAELAREKASVDCDDGSPRKPLISKPNL